MAKQESREEKFDFHAHTNRFRAPDMTPGPFSTEKDASVGRGVAAGYGGDISCLEAWRKLRQMPMCALVDVRTPAEWNFVGIPDLSSIGKNTLLVEWLGFPDASPIPGFPGRLKSALKVEYERSRDDGQHHGDLLFLCRSGTRSLAAARLAANEGLGRCFNVVEGFEGPLDSSGHRCSVEGWKVAGLPWRQN